MNKNQYYGISALCKRDLCVTLVSHVPFYLSIYLYIILSLSLPYRTTRWKWNDKGSIRKVKKRTKESRSKEKRIKKTKAIERKTGSGP